MSEYSNKRDVILSQLDEYSTLEHYETIFKTEGIEVFKRECPCLIDEITDSRHSDLSRRSLQEIEDFLFENHESNCFLTLIIGITLSKDSSPSSEARSYGLFYINNWLKYCLIEGEGIDQELTKKGIDRDNFKTMLMQTIQSLCSRPDLMGIFYEGQYFQLELPTSLPDHSSKDESGHQGSYGDERGNYNLGLALEP